ncbi:OsmC family protein [Vicingus serpentipes]|uniref:OsmC family protein n=1 Tax=Vicingus serpentipes TaxID=1926625 RepID=A0A5C6RTD9_9FLAO|nr:OsmC family protein [Vicingus serpentipes]TXB64592.1 OsmC family protein [Vicingus serpentipes]
MKVNLKRVNQAFHYEAKNEDKIIVNIDANPAIGGEGKGARPMELVLMGLGGCASIDLGLILKKQRQVLDDYQVEVSATRDETPSKAFKSINVHFVLTGSLDADKVEKAIDLTLTKYCSVALSLNKEIEITATYTIK